MKRKKLSLEAIETLKEKSYFKEKEVRNSKVENNDGLVIEKQKMEWHIKNIRYPRKWHNLLLDSKMNGKTSLDELSYIVEALRCKMVQDGILQ